MGATGDVIVVGMTGASGQTFGATAVSLLAEQSVEVHLILSRASITNLRQEGDVTPDELREIADATYDGSDDDAAVAASSFEADGMIVAPCSMKTLAGIAHSEDANLIARVANGLLDERAPVVVMPREKPLNLIHLRNMRGVTDAGATVMPPNLETTGFDADGTFDGPVRRQVARALEVVGVAPE